MLAAVQPSPAPAMAVQATLAAKPALKRCHVVIKMPDGSRGEHVGLYPHACDALDYALEAFPEATVISVVVARGRRSAT